MRTVAQTLTLLKAGGPDYRALHRIADGFAPELRREFEKLFRDLRDTVDLDALGELLEAGHLDQALGVLRDVKVENFAQVEQTLTKVAQEMSAKLAPSLGMSFDAVNPAAVRWAERYTGQLVTGINAETQRAISDVVTRGLVEGIAPRDQAKLIGNVVGLSRRDAGAVSTFLSKMLEDELPRAHQMAERYATRLLRQRSLTIARTETIRAANMGQQLLWETAVGDGLLSQTIQKVWIVTPDDRLCPKCAALEGEVVGLGESFTLDREAVGDPESWLVSDKGEQRRNPNMSFRPLKTPIVETSPPAHVRCRCSMGLVEV